MKQVWLTSLSKDEKEVQQVMKSLKGYGLGVDGHFWEDDLEKMAWMGPRDMLLSKDIAAWLLYIRGDAFIKKESVRYGLSLLAMTVTAARGLDFPILALLDGAELDAESLSTPLAGMELMDVSNPASMAKIVAAVHKTRGKSVQAPGYRIDVYGNPQIGQWFETGSGDGGWKGAVFGVSGGNIVFQAVGPKGRLPERSVLHYPVQGMDIEMGGQKFTAWGVQNELTEADSYFVKVEGQPDAIIFGPYPHTDEAEVYKIRLK